MTVQQELLRAAREDLAFFSNEQKAARERWVAERWLLARRVVGVEVGPGGGPPDFIVGGWGVEVVEVLEPGRRRTDDYRAKLAAAEKGQAHPRALVRRARVLEGGHEWVLDAIHRKAERYGAASSCWALLIYVNLPYAAELPWADLAARLELSAPPFVNVEAVFEAAPGPRAVTIWRADPPDGAP